MMERTKILQREYVDGTYRGLAEVKWDDSIKSTIRRKANVQRGDWPFIKVTCGCCDRSYDIASEIHSIETEGYCKWCMLYKLGKADYIHIHEPATIDEVVEEILKRKYRVSASTASNELRMLVNEVRSLHAQLENHNL